jgi:cobalt-precorrin 5A hydrolase
MDVGQTVIVAGFGYRKGVSAADIEAALVAALARPLPAGEALDCMAAPVRKAGERGLVDVAAARGVDIVPISQDALEAVHARALSFSPRALAAMNVPSVAECAALAAGGPTARLLAPRVAVGPVTCALALKEVIP